MTPVPRTTLALKFGLYSPALIGPLFLALSLAGEGLKRGSLQVQLDVSPGLLVPSVLILSYLAFGAPAFLTGVFAATFGPTIERWEVYQGACVIVCAALCAGSYLLFVRFMGMPSEQDRILVWVAGFSGGMAAALSARWTRAEHEEASRKTDAYDD